MRRHSVAAVAARVPTAPSGREAARLFAEQSEQIFGYCFRQLGSRTDAEDAVQTTFLYALRALRRGVVPECESAWLTTIAKNVCHWQRRTLDRRGSLTSDLDLDGVASARRVDGEEQELCRDLREALASIPEDQRRALVLREWHGLSSSEVAAQLGMSRPATYALLTRARRSLVHALTALPQRAALSLATLVYEFRSNIKALFGGSAAAKTIAAATVVAAVTVGGVSLERTVAGDRGAPRPPAPGLFGADAAEAQHVSLSFTLAAGSVRDRVPRPSLSSPVGPAFGDSGETPADTSAPTSAATEEVVSADRQEEIGGETKSELVPLPNLLPEPPQLPAAELPTDLLPPAPELPPTSSIPVPSADDLPAPPPPPDVDLPNLLPK